MFVALLRGNKPTEERNERELVLAAPVFNHDKFLSAHVPALAYALRLQRLPKEGKASILWLSPACVIELGCLGWLRLRVQRLSHHTTSSLVYNSFSSLEVVEAAQTFSVLPFARLLFRNSKHNIDKHATFLANSTTGMECAIMSNRTRLTLRMSIPPKSRNLIHNGDSLADKYEVSLHIHLDGTRNPHCSMPNMSTFGCVADLHPTKTLHIINLQKKRTIWML